MTKHTPDDRRDNVRKIQNNIDQTIKKIEAAEEMIAKSDNEKDKKDLTDKNERRKDALQGFKKEIRDEALDRERGYQ